jgi:hypothetical protein
MENAGMTCPICGKPFCIDSDENGICTSANCEHVLSVTDDVCHGHLLTSGGVTANAILMGLPEEHAKEDWEAEWEKHKEALWEMAIVGSTMTVAERADVIGGVHSFIRSLIAKKQKEAAETERKRIYELHGLS